MTIKLDSTGWTAREVEERIRITADAAKHGVALTDRWAELETSSEVSDRWIRRARRAIKMLGPVSSVADLGCGTMHVRELLPAGTRYIPVDLVSRGPGSIVLDLDRDEIPDLGAEAALALGVIHYLHDVPRFLANVRRRFSRFVVTYHPIETTPEGRLFAGWVNDYSHDDCLRLLSEAGFTDVVWRDFGRQKIYAAA